MTCSRPQRNVHRRGIEPGTPWSEIRRPIHCANPPLVEMFILAFYPPKLIWVFVFAYMQNVCFLVMRLIYSFSNARNVYSCIGEAIYEPHHEKTNVLHICENKGADQLRGYREADQRLCFRYKNNTIPPLSKSEISSL